MNRLCTALVCVLYLSLPAHLTAQGKPGTITTFAGTGTAGFLGDGGPAAQARLSRPIGVAVDAKGNVYITDYSNHRIRRVRSDSIITTLAGTEAYGFSGDGGPATQARLLEPFGVTVNAKGDIYIADSKNQRIRRVDPDGIITTFAGTGTFGFSGDGGPATQASLKNPIDVTVDTKGNIYIADFDNHRIRRVGPDGIITTFAGTGIEGFSGDGGPATQASLKNPIDVTVDTKEFVYIADTYNHRIRRVGLDGIITTIVGTGNPGFSGDGGPATHANLNAPAGVAVDANGNIYIADLVNHRIRRVRPDGIIMTFSGSGPTGLGDGGFSGDGGPATQARLNLPRSVAVDVNGNIYIADLLNHRVRQVEVEPLAEVRGLASDFDGNGAVGFDDFFAFASVFGQKATGANAKFDLDRDGEVGFGDFFLFAEDFGKTAKSSKAATLSSIPWRRTTPTPSTRRRRSPTPSRRPEGCG